MPPPSRPWCQILFLSIVSVATPIKAAAEVPLTGGAKQGWSKGDLVPVTCLNRTIDTGEHIADSAGSLQWIPFPVCNETSLPLALPFNTPTTLPCTIDSLSDELYHLLEFYTHDDVPLTCRVPSTPLASTSNSANTLSTASSSDETSLLPPFTPFQIALQGTLQLSHLHIHTSINALLHTIPITPSPPNPKAKPVPPDQQPYRIIAATAYSVPNTTTDTTSSASSFQGQKIIRTSPLPITFNLGWIDGAVLPGMVGRPVTPSVKDHGVGFFLLSFFALGASAGVGGMVVLFYERGKWRRGKGMDGLLGGGGGRGSVGALGGYGGYGSYGGYGGYGGSGAGKRD